MSANCLAPEATVAIMPKGLARWVVLLLSGCQKVTDAEVREVYHSLNRIKQHRNNIMHPEWVLTVDEAFALFDHAKSAIMIMLPRLPEKKPSAKAKAQQAA